VSDEDLTLLEQLLTAHGGVLTTVQLRLAKELDLPVTSRTKTTGTLVEKLQRSPTMALSRMQDIAGARLVVEMNWTEQDQLVARIVELFPGADVKDRRAEPSYGYRAVHVIVEVDQRFVEIQVRTTLQDLWAQVFERLADRWGRGIRYGELPIDPDAEVGGGRTRREIVEWLMRQSELLHALENLADDFAKDEKDNAEAEEVTSELKADPDWRSDPEVVKIVQQLEVALKEIQRLKEEHRALEEEQRRFLEVLRRLE
jgi:ppGpp synthetase/RelA/SpoT-type nucleotidyltranferase